MTYNVFGGTLNLSQSNAQQQRIFHYNRVLVTSPGIQALGIAQPSPLRLFCYLYPI